MRAILDFIFSFFLSPHGLLIMAALDSTLLWVLPFGIDVVLVLLVAENPEWFWLYPLIAAGGSVAGATLTFWIGRKIGDKGLTRFVQEKRLEKVRRRVRSAGAVALGALALIPGPFPFKVFILASGALDVSAKLFFSSMAVARITRYGLESLLAVYYGDQIAVWLESDTFQNIVAVFILLACGASGFSIYKVSRR